MILSQSNVWLCISVETVYLLYYICVRGSVCSRVSVKYFSVIFLVFAPVFWENDISGES